MIRLPCFAPLRDGDRFFGCVRASVWRIYGPRLRLPIFVPAVVRRPCRTNPSVANKTMAVLSVFVR